MDSIFGLSAPYSPPLPLDDSDSSFYIPQMADFNLESEILPLSPPVDSRLAAPTVTPSTIPVSLREPTPSHNTLNWNRIDADSISDFVPPLLASHTLADAHTLVDAHYDASASTSHPSVPISFQQQENTNQTTTPDASPFTSQSNTHGASSSSISSNKNKRRHPKINGIPYHTLYDRQWVDPITGQLSNAENAIHRSTYRIRTRKVDPMTGKPSTAENAISRTTFNGRQLVDPLTGKPSTAENAISRNMFHKRQLVDPHTGKLSTAENAIPRNTYHKRQLVDPITGKPSTDVNSISYTAYTNRKLQNKKIKSVV